MKNKGFSLVELIIVIAIMAILVGLMAPFLYRYVEKTNVSSDIQLCDTVKEAVNIARSDPDVRNDADSAVQIAYLEEGNIYSIDMAQLTNETEFTDAVADIIGVKVIGDGSNGVDAARGMMKSKVAKQQGILTMQMDGNNLYVWIEHSDYDGGNDNNSCSDITQIADSGVIYAN